MHKAVDDIAEKIGVHFSNSLLLQEALTHRSYINEHPTWPVTHNERLEFLGDAVLELIVTEKLFHTYTEFDEGRLTGIRSALVNHHMLARVARELKLETYLFLSKGESRGSEKAREAIQANAVEALIGAVYLDQGYESAERFVEQYILQHLNHVMDSRLYRDPKSLLQEHVQEKMKETPVYTVLSESGPDHEKEFVIGVYAGEELLAQGTGDSKHKAEIQAATAALEETQDHA